MGLAKNHKSCDIPFGHGMVPKIFWGRFIWPGVERRSDGLFLLEAQVQP